MQNILRLFEGLSEPSDGTMVVTSWGWEEEEEEIIRCCGTCTVGVDRMDGQCVVLEAVSLASRTVTADVVCGTVTADVVCGRS